LGSCCICLVDSVESMIIHGLENPKFKKTCNIPCNKFLFMKQGSNLYSSQEFSLTLLITNIFQDEAVKSLFRECLYNSVF
jgi:hypothetical protein